MFRCVVSGLATTTSSQGRTRPRISPKGDTVPASAEILAGHEFKIPADLVKALVRANEGVFSSQDLWDCCVLSAPPSLNLTLEIVSRCQRLNVSEYLVFAPVEKPEYFPFENSLGKQGTMKILPVESLVETIRQSFVVTLEVMEGDVCLRLTPKVRPVSIKTLTSTEKETDYGR